VFFWKIVRIGLKNIVGNDKIVRVVYIKQLKDLKVIGVYYNCLRPCVWKLEIPLIRKDLNQKTWGMFNRWVSVFPLNLCVEKT